MRTATETTLDAIISGGWANETTGHVESPTGHVALIDLTTEREAIAQACEVETLPPPGWYVVTTDDHGFIYYDVATETEARNRYAELDAMYQRWDADDTITADDRTHLPAMEAMADIADVHHGLRPCIRDTTAVTVASWYASPGSVGAALAQLSTSGSASAQELLDDITATRNELRDPHTWPALDALSAWVTDHPSITDD